MNCKCFRFYERKYEVFKKMNEDQLQYRTIMTLQFAGWAVFQPNLNRNQTFDYMALICFAYVLV